jgi:hypothetical protein
MRLLSSRLGDDALNMKMKREITWRRTHSPVNESQIREVEELLNLRLPRDFRTLIATIHGGTPDAPYLAINDSRHGKMGTALANLLSLDQTHPLSLIGTIEALQDQLPPGLVPFGEDPGGDYFCFDYRFTQVDPPVVYWHHSRTGLDAITALAPSFDAFIEMLGEDPAMTK